MNIAATAHDRSMTENRIDNQLTTDESTLTEARQLLRAHLSRLGLKHSNQREIILGVFLAAHDHLSTEELHRRVKQRDASVGYTTVYRTLKLFANCGLATEIAFHDGVTRYEPRLNRRHHHHMVCTGCGASVEFFAPEIEAIEQSVGQQYGFATARHSFQIYGLCAACRPAPSPSNTI